MAMQVLRGKPEEVFPQVWEEWGITKLCFEKDTEPYAKQRDAKIIRMAEDAGWSCLFDTHFPRTWVYRPQIVPLQLPTLAQ